MASPRSLKRTFAEAWLEDSFHAGTPLHTTLPTSVPPPSTPPPPAEVRPLSTKPAVSPASLPYGPYIPPFTYSTDFVHPSGSNLATPGKPSKVQKLSFAEKEAKRLEKEACHRENAERKAQNQEEIARKLEERAQRIAGKDADKARRQAQKDAKAAEREEKRRGKEEAKRLKQEEKTKKEAEQKEEKMKKAKSQLRLNAFFPIPSLPNSSLTNSPTRDGPSPLASRRGSITDIKIEENVEAQCRSRSNSATPQKAKQTDFERSFAPFFVQSHTILAPYSRFARDDDGLQWVQARIDEKLEAKEENDLQAKDTVLDTCSLLHIPTSYGLRRRPQIPIVKSLVEQINGTAQNPIDLTESQYQRATQKAIDLLRKIPLKYLKFAEDVRPPYVGTYTRLQDSHSISELARDPFARDLPKTDYDYDSEAEWEEPGEGEDLESEGEEELGEDEDEAEMEGFLDDEDATDARAARRRPILGDLEPTCTGLCWEGPEILADNSNGLAMDRLAFKLDMLRENPQFPIDPYSDAYWAPAPTSTPLKSTTSTTQGQLMDPPRIPLQPTNRQNTLLAPSAAQGSDPSAKMKPPKPPKRLLPTELMIEFKAAVDGNDLTKMGLIEVLKKRFPKQPKDAIKDTLDLVAERVGSKAAEKRWVIKAGV